MDQVDHISTNKQQNHKPIMFDVIDPSIVRAQFASTRDASFSSYLQHHNLNNNNKDHNLQNHQQQNCQNRTEDSDQISIFDAAKYFSGLNDEQNDHHHHHHHQNYHRAGVPQHSTSKVLDLSSMGRLSSVSSVDNNSSYRARSFHATPTASSEASWNSQTGLLTNPPGSIGINMIKNLSPNNSTSSNNATRWPRFSTKWLNRGRRCPCSGKKSVQVEERIEVKTPRMVDLRRSTSSNGTNASSLYSPRQNSPKNSATTTTTTITNNNNNIALPVIGSQLEPTINRNFGLNPIPRKCDLINNTNNSTNCTSHLGSNPKVTGTITSTSNTNTSTSNKVATTSTTGTGSSNVGFTFPILENQPMGVKKMFNVITQENHQQDPHRDSLEVYQPRAHMSPKSRRTSYEDENASDGSSDLFEIESFSATTTTANYNPARRDSLEEASANFSASMKRFGMVCHSDDLVMTAKKPVCRELYDDNDHESVAPTECYAPSEVSIDWSVTTAEGFDRSSLASASEIGWRPEGRRSSSGGAAESGGGGRRNNGSGLLSCRCEKAVSVGPTPIKCLSAEVGPEVGPTTRHVGGRAQQQSGRVAAHVKTAGVGVGRSR